MQTSLRDALAQAYFMNTDNLRLNFINYPSSGLAIDLFAISKTYTDKRGKIINKALESINLQIPVGCIFGLLGPNGAGKSTLINILAGTVIKSSGTAVVWGTDIDINPRQARANIGIVPQELNVDAFFTPRQTIDLMAGLFGVPKNERHTDAILELVGLTEQADLYARRLSGGMRRRLLIGKAMVHQPPVLILDEPTAGVDVALRQRLWENIKTLNAAGVTVVLTTHYLKEAETLCDQIAIINKGKIVTAKSKFDLMASAGKKQLIISFTSPLPNPIPKKLQSLGAEWEGGQLLIKFDPIKTKATSILKEVQKANCEISDIRIKEPDLEEIFIGLTQEN